MTKKIIQETFLRLKEALPIASLCTHVAPKEQIDLSPSETLYGRTFFFFLNVNDLFKDPETQTLWSYAMVLCHGHWAIPTKNMFVRC